jgi:hypothetical protein
MVLHTIWLKFFANPSACMDMCPEDRARTDEGSGAQIAERLVRYNYAELFNVASDGIEFAVLGENEDDGRDTLFRPVGREPVMVQVKNLNVDKIEWAEFLKIITGITRLPEFKQSPNCDIVVVSKKTKNRGGFSDDVVKNTQVNDRIKLLVMDYDVSMLTFCPGHEISFHYVRGLIEQWRHANDRATLVPPPPPPTRAHDAHDWDDDEEDRTGGRGGEQVESDEEAVEARRQLHAQSLPLGSHAAGPEGLPSAKRPQTRSMGRPPTKRNRSASAV